MLCVFAKSCVSLGRSFENLPAVRLLSETKVLSRLVNSCFAYRMIGVIAQFGVLEHREVR